METNECKHSKILAIKILLRNKGIQTEKKNE